MKRIYADILVKGIDQDIYHCTDECGWGVNYKLNKQFSWPAEDGMDAIFEWDKAGHGSLTIKLKGVELQNIQCNIPPYIMDNNLIISCFEREKFQQDVHIGLSGKGLSKDTPLMPEDWYQKGLEYWEKKRAKS